MFENHTEYKLFEDGSDWNVVAKSEIVNEKPTEPVVLYEGDEIAVAYEAVVIDANLSYVDKYAEMEDYVPFIPETDDFSGKEYGVFANEFDDFYVTAKLENGNVSVLYEGSGRDGAFETILFDKGLTVSIEERDMETGTYVPTIEDFS